MFDDRLQAGRLLGEHLRARIEGPAVVLAIPRGGVIVAGPVAAALNAPLDVIIPRKIGAPGEPELAVGALALAAGEEIALFDEDSVERLMVSRQYLEAEVARQKREIERREKAYRGGRPPVSVAGCTVVIVDDGIATGLTARAAAAAVARRSPKQVVVAVPVAPPEALEEFRREGVQLEALATPPFFMAVGQFYQDFHAVEDEEVLYVLRSASPPVC